MDGDPHDNEPLSTHEAEHGKYPWVDPVTGAISRRLLAEPLSRQKFDKAPRWSLRIDIPDGPADPKVGGRATAAGPLAPSRSTPDVRGGVGRARTRSTSWNG